MSMTAGLENTDAAFGADDCERDDRPNSAYLGPGPAHRRSPRRSDAPHGEGSPRGR